MLQMNDPSGLFETENGLVRIYQTFVYELNIYKYWKGGFCQMGSKLYKSNKLLDIKKDNIIEKYDDYFIQKEITLIGVPQKFVDENQLKVYKPIIKKSKKNEQRNRSKRQVC